MEKVSLQLPAKVYVYELCKRVLHIILQKTCEVYIIGDIIPQHLVLESKSTINTSGIPDFEAVKLPSTTRAEHFWNCYSCKQGGSYYFEYSIGCVLGRLGILESYSHDEKRRRA